MSKVIILKADTYDRNLLKDKISEIFGSLGILEEIIFPKTEVLLKPNLLSARLPEELVDTHPEFVRAVIEVLKMRTSNI